MLKRLPVTEAERLEIFDREEDVKKEVSEARVNVQVFSSRVDPASPTGNKSHDGSDTNSDSHHLKREKMQNPKFSGDMQLFARCKSNFEKIFVLTSTNRHIL